MYTLRKNGGKLENVTRRFSSIRNVLEISVKTLAGSCSPLLRAMFLPLLFQLNPFIALHRFGDRFFDRQTLHARSPIETVHPFGLMENIFGVLRL